MEVMSIDGRAVGEAVADRLPRALVREDSAAGDWALRTLLAGRHAAPVRVEVQTDSGAPKRGLPAGTVQPAEVCIDDEIHRSRHRGCSPPQQPWPCRPGSGVGRGAEHLARDGRTHSRSPGHGRRRQHDGRARPSRSTRTGAPLPYQRHDLPGEERRYGVPRIWVEHVSPRGTDTYDKSVAVLVGRRIASMGEGVAIGLDGLGRATVFGTVMAGLQGATYSHTLEHTGISVRGSGRAVVSRRWDAAGGVRTAHADGIGIVWRGCRARRQARWSSTDEPIPMRR